VAYFKIRSHHYTEGNEKYHELLSKKPVYGPIFEIRISKNKAGMMKEVRQY
jgi:hypothetical protein